MNHTSPRAIAIASEMIGGLFHVTASTSLYRMYVLASRYGIDFNLAAIPTDSPLEMDPTVFDTAAMQKLFDQGYRLSESGYEWAKAPSGLDPDELFHTTKKALLDNEFAQNIAQNAKNVITQNQGATQKTIKAIKKAYPQTDVVFR